MASPTSRCAILLSLLFADTAALRLGAAASRPRRVRLYLSLPRELLALNVIPAAVAEAESTAENWAALRECFPTEAEALAAVEKNPATLLPYGFDSENRAENIRGSYGVLQDVLESEAEVQEVLVKNPGVLGCIPRQLAKASADDIKRAASVANGFDAVLGPAKRFLNNLPGWDESANEGHRWWEIAVSRAQIVCGPCVCARRVSSTNPISNIPTFGPSARAPARR